MHPLPHAATLPFQHPTTLPALGVSAALQGLPPYYSPLLAPVLGVSPSWALGPASEVWRGVAAQTVG